MATTGIGLIDIPGQMLEFHERVCESAEGGGWNKVGARVGISGSYARLIALGQRRLLPVIAARWLGEVDWMAPTVRVLACPSCGGAHVLADCHGAPVAAVVGLAPGETVKRPGKTRTRKHYHRPCMDDATYELWLAFKAAREQLEEEDR